MNLRPGKTKHCVFDGCTSDSRYGAPVEFLQFPQPCFRAQRHSIKVTAAHLGWCELCERCIRWIKLCKRRDGRFNDILQVNRHKFICKKHFVHPSGPNDTFPDPLPASTVMKIREKSITHTRSQETLGSMENALNASDNNQENLRPNLNDGTANLELLASTCMAQYEARQQSSEIELPAIVEVSRQIKDSGTQTTFTWKLMELIEEANSNLKKENADLKKENAALKQANDDLKKQVIELGKKRKNDVKNREVTTFVDSLKGNEQKCKFYTNLNFNQIQILYSFLQPTDNLRYWGRKGSVQRPFRRRFSPQQELILTLVRLRTGLLLDDMGYRFNIAKSSLSDIFITWVQHCFHKFNTIRTLMFASRDKIRENLPAVFRRLKNIRVIIDCAEFYCESPSNFEQQGNLYSSYKASTTFKVLIGCTPNGAVSFISDLFEGSISDKELVKQSKLMEQLEEGDLVLADRGFDLKADARKPGVMFNIPPFLQGRKSLTAEEEIETKNVARERIYVEHVVGRLKKFRLLKKCLPLNMQGILSNLVVVCAFLLNFQTPVVGKHTDPV